MSEKRISDVEKEVAILKATQEPLLDKIDRNTEASLRSEKAIVGLTHSIDSLVKTQHDFNKKYENHENRIKTLELKDASEQSGKELMTWFKRSIVGGIVTALFVGLGFILNLYYSQGG